VTVPGTASPPALTAWLDVSAGVAGDMVCGALVDAGAPLDRLQAAADAVVPGCVRIEARTVTRSGLRATKVSVEVLARDERHRPWAAVRELLSRSSLPAPVLERADVVFARLAEAEGRVHGVGADRVEFHEVGSLDAIADVVGTCAALHVLGVDAVCAGPMALGSGEVVGAHGRLPVPVPAVLELTRGRRVLAGGEGELATPTGAAIVAALATDSLLPELTISAVGVGAGDRDTPARPNVVRVVLGQPPGPGAGPAGLTGLAGLADATVSAAVLIETNVDDLDPRAWPAVLGQLLAAGAADAWLTPILMKKGRPAHTLSVLTDPGRAPALRRVVLRETSAIGLRETPATKHALARTWVPVPVAGGQVRVKVATAGGLIVHATAEFEDVAGVAAASRRPVRDVLEEAAAAAVAAGLTPGSPVPPGQDEAI
jgi:uncharacterized protein (TIGR00299 family) protein